ncbi:hypothetical protein GR223_37225 [Rhizobium leguminosarum]|uniref:hypothetical protein n=1 Tax=Rhizobium TaxID=379 RepID=UPI0013E06361|nr:hypothetical protein [Rhizobium ruizarguesonis]NEJ91504.1 hypothetical protein [Rhizobium ruizarguesonis]
MTKISLNAQAIGIAISSHNTDKISTGTRCAFIPVVVHKPGIDAIFEGLRLANIEGFEKPNASRFAKDIDPRDGVE